MSDFLRIFSPRLERAVKSLELLANGAKYQPAPDDVQDMFLDLDNALDTLRAQYGCQKQEAVSDTPVEVKAIPIGKSDHYLKLSQNVEAIPVDQLASYLTQVANRICEVADPALSKQEVWLR